MATGCELVSLVRCHSRSRSRSVESEHAQLRRSVHSCAVCLHLRSCAPPCPAGLSRSVDWCARRCAAVRLASDNDTRVDSQSAALDPLRSHSVGIDHAEHCQPPATALSTRVDSRTRFRIESNARSHSNFRSACDRSYLRPNHRQLHSFLIALVSLDALQSRQHSRIRSLKGAQSSSDKRRQGAEAAEARREEARRRRWSCIGSHGHQRRRRRGGGRCERI